MSDEALLPTSPATADHGTLPQRSATEIIALLSDELDRGGGGVIATDADGTLWDGDVGVDNFEALLAREGVREAARDRLAKDAEELGLPIEGKSPSALAASLYGAYANERYPHDRAFAMMAWAFAGWHEDEVGAFAQRVLDDGRIEARLRPEMQQVLAWADAHKVQVFVVSASPIAIVEAATGRLGLPITRALAMTPKLGADRVLEACLDGPIVYAEGKVRALEGAGAPAPLLAAFGDSPYDADMLRAARVPVAVTPSRRLLAVASTIGGLLELRRGQER